MKSKEDLKDTYQNKEKKKDEVLKEKGRLIMNEEKQEGEVKFEVYKYYMEQGGWLNILMIILMFSVS